MTYEEFHQHVYDHFRDHFAGQRGWFFTMRKDGGKFPLYASVKSGYVATSFWRMTSREGMKLTPTIAIMIYMEEDHFFYKFACKQRQEANSRQDESVLKLIQGIRIKNIWRQGNIKGSRESSKDLTLSLYSEENYSSLQQLFTALESDLERFIVDVDELIATIKDDYSAFDARRLTANDLEEELEEYERKRRLKKKEQTVSSPMKKSEVMSFSTPLNQILYGPPGTGKTYETIAAAVRIVNPGFVQVDRTSIREEFHRLIDLGNIVFTTFHQSLSYEDFVEGLKPKIEGENEQGDIGYEIKPGVFRDLAEKASGRYDLEGEKDDPVAALGLQNLDVDKSRFYKFSLGDATKEEDREIYEYCVKNDCIALGYGDAVSYETATTSKEIKNLLVETTGETTGLQAIQYFRGKLKEGDVVMISRGLSHVRAVGVINGEYEFKEDAPIRYQHFRQVKWLKTDIDYPILPLYGRRLSQSTIYAFDQAAIKNKLRETDRGPFNYVLIIDEINRGNVSRIFGELITLLEPDKRLGREEALTVTLPYSRDTFGVPPNLYLIGTMNTADRSVVALDSALRRRFRFTEVAPDPKVIGQVLTTTKVMVDSRGFDLAEIMTTINNRIEFLRDRDHLIGHSYFLKMKTAADVAEQFTTGIIPLLREYFYEDYGQLLLILGEGFIGEKKGKKLVSLPTGVKNNDLGLNEYRKYTVESFRGENGQLDEGKLAAALEVLLGEKKPAA